MLSFLSFVGFSQTTDEELAYYYYNNEEYDKAKLYLERVYDVNPSKQNFDYYLATLLELKEYKDAEKISKKQVKRYPKNVFYKVQLGSIYEKIGEEDKAKKYFDELVEELDKTSGYGAFSQLGSEFTRINKLDYALAVYQKGEKVINNPHLGFGILIADIYGRQGKDEEMIDAYLDILSKREDQLGQIENMLSRTVDFTEDNKKEERLRVELLRRIQKSPGKTVYNRLLIWYYQQRSNFRSAFLQVKALDKREKAEGREVYRFAQLCMSNKEYDLAIQAYDYILTEFSNTNYFYSSAERSILQALQAKITKSADYTNDDLVKLEERYLKTLKGVANYAERTPVMLDLVDLEVYYLHDLDTALILLDQVLGYPGISKSNLALAKIAKADVLLIKNDVWDASLLYLQVEKMYKEDVLGHTAKFKNAKLYYYTGDYEWCQAQLNGLKASTSKLISNDAIDLSLLITDNYNMDTTVRRMNWYSQADLLILQNKYPEALAKLDSITQDVDSSHSLFDEILYKKYEISFLKREYKEAESYLNQIVASYPDDILADNALFKLGELYENQLSDEVKAIKTYEKLLFDYPGSLYVVETRKRYRSYRENRPDLFDNKINKIGTDGEDIYYQDDDGNLNKIEKED